MKNFAAKVIQAIAFVFVVSVAVYLLLLASVLLIPIGAIAICMAVLWRFMGPSDLQSDYNRKL